MASLYILKKLCKGLSPNTFIPAITNVDILVSSVSKLYIEHTLLKTEMNVYNIILSFPAYTSLGDSFHKLLIPYAISLLITMPIIYGIPIYRTYKSIVNKNLQIINFEKN